MATAYNDWIKSVHTKTQPKYKTAWSVLMEFYKKRGDKKVTPDVLLDRIVEDRKKPVREQGAIEQDINEWAKWLEKDYQQRKRGVNGGRLDKRGLSAGTIKMYLTAIRSFFTYFGFSLSKKVKLPRHIRMSNGKLENIKIQYRPEQVKKLLSVIKSLRDKTITLIMFQSGMDISTACSLNYADVVEGLERGDEPLMIHVKRPKVGLNYRTFIGRDGIEALNLSLNERRVKHGEKLTYDSPLFISEGKNSKKGIRCKPKHFQDAVREYVVLAGIVRPERMERADFQPGRPHALRTGFADICRLHGLNEKLIDYFMGHSDSYGGAYNNATDEELREKYVEIEPNLSVSSVSSLNDLERGLRSEIEKRDYLIIGMDDRLKQLEAQNSLIMRALEKIGVNQ